MRNLNLKIEHAIIFAFVILTTALFSGYFGERMVGFFRFNNSDTNKSHSYIKDFSDAVHNFETKRKGAFQKINVAQKLADKAPLNKKNTSPITEVEKSKEDDKNAIHLQSDKDLKLYSNEVEQQWNRLSSDIKGLNEDFRLLRDASFEYFKELDRVARSIKNSAYRKKELKKNEELKQEWVEAYQEAKSKIRELDGILDEGQDFQHIILLSSMRSSISQVISEFKGVTMKATDLIDDLKYLSKRGEAMTSA